MLYLDKLDTEEKKKRSRRKEVRGKTVAKRADAIRKSFKNTERRTTKERIIEAERK